MSGASVATQNADIETLLLMLRALRLPTMRAMAKDVVLQAQQHGWSHPQFLHALLEAEVSARAERRTNRMLRDSNLPLGKQQQNFETKRLPSKAAQQLPALFAGGFVDAKHNVLIFGQPGVGKTHLAAAVGHRLVAQGRKVLFIDAAKMVQRLLAAKHALQLEALLTKLDRFACIIIDDIGYVSQSKEEMEVLFALLAQRYERGSVIITSNLVFSQWDKIFKDPMTTAAAIDRLVHHCVIVEINATSYRKEHALANQNQP